MKPKYRSRPIITRIAAILLLAGAGHVAPARAGHLITYRFAGVIDDTQVSSRVPVGTPFSGTFTYDLDAVNLSDLSFAGLYEFPLPGSAPVGFSYTVGARSFSATELAELSVADDIVEFFDDDLVIRADHFSFRGDSPGGDGDLIDGLIELHGPTTALSSVRPPGTLDLSDFDRATFSGTILVRVPSPRGGSRLVEYSFSGPIDTLTLAAVPEPSTFVLMGTGVMAVLARALGRTWGGRVPRRTDR